MVRLKPLRFFAQDTVAWEGKIEFWRKWVAVSWSTEKSTPRKVVSEFSYFENSRRYNWFKKKNRNYSLFLKNNHSTGTSSGVIKTFPFLKCTLSQQTLNLSKIWDHFPRATFSRRSPYNYPFFSKFNFYLSCNGVLLEET